MKLLVIPFMRKKKTFVREYVWFTPYRESDLLTAELFFKLCIPQRYGCNLEIYWKNSVRIGVSFFNL